MAYEILKEPDLRRKYDLYGKEGLAMSNKKQTYHSWTYYQNNFDMYEDDQHVVTLGKHDYCKYTFILVFDFIKFN